MPKDGNKTRLKILDEATKLVFKNGFAGTTIDHILERTEITKGAFFYHFKTKQVLAEALVQHYADEDMSHLNVALKETETLKDPKSRLLQFVQLFIDMMLNIKEPPSCLYASYTYESNQFDKKTLDIVSGSLYHWRNTFTELLTSVLSDYKMVMKADIQSLADQFTVIFEGGYVVSKALNEAELTAKQLQHFKNYLELLFERK